MAVYEVIYTEEYVGWFSVEADSDEEAMEKFNARVSEGKINRSEMELMNSSIEVVIDVKKGKSSHDQGD